jgi:phosphoribosylaminoimidazole-succinocarboxamide synthase
MGSVKDVAKGNEFGGKLYEAPRINEFGLGVWPVTGRFSVRDLKSLIPPVEIEHKAEALTMMTARFFEWLAQYYPEIDTCYEGVLDPDERLVTTSDLLDKGITSKHIVMRMAYTPQTFCNGNNDIYREALSSGVLRCGVADVESIFRKGFPLGSSRFADIFASVGMKDVYLGLSTYDHTVRRLDDIRSMVRMQGIEKYPGLEQILVDSGLSRVIPNPGHILNDFTYDTTSKFEVAGDRKLSKKEERTFSGLSEDGYDLWTKHMFPSLAQAQIEFAEQHNLLNIDGKVEIVAYQRLPIVTDFCCTVDENRLMIPVTVDGVEWLIPSNKEIQRAIFKQAGVDYAIDDAKKAASRDGKANEWLVYMPAALKERNIELQSVTDYSCKLMASAVAEVGNRILGQRVFDAKPLDTWVRDFLPYASRMERQV